MDQHLKPIVCCTNFKRDALRYRKPHNLTERQNQKPYLKLYLSAPEFTILSFSVSTYEIKNHPQYFL